MTQVFEFPGGNEWLKDIFAAGWTPKLTWLYVLSDVPLVLFYGGVFSALIYLVSDRKGQRFCWLYRLLGVFLLICGATHLVSAVLMWQFLYWPDAGTKAVAAIVFIITAIVLARIIPQVLYLPIPVELENKAEQSQPALHKMEAKLQALNTQFSALIETIPDAVFLKDGEGRLIIANGAAKRLFKLNSIYWKGKTNLELAALYPELSAIQTTGFINDDAAWNKRELHVDEDCGVEDEAGYYRQFSVRKAPFFNENGDRQGMVVIGCDKTDLWRAEQELRIAAITIESQEGIIVTDANKRILRVNSAFTRLTGYRAEEVLGKTPAMLKSGRHNETFYKAMSEKLRQEKYWQGEIWDRRKNGEIYPKWLTISAVIDPAGQVSHYVGAFTDLSEHKDAEAAIHRLAFYDPLTDLPNRRFLNERLALAMSTSSRNHRFVAIVMIDLDNFKAINDTKGHGIGDQLLIKVADRLKACVRQGDTLSRLGGDEFVVVLENLNIERSRAVAQAQGVAAKILNAIKQPYLLDEYKHYTSASIGVSLFVNHDAASEEILKQADAAMYQAKNAGRNTIRLFDPHMQASLESRMLLESELRHALTQNQFQLYYQIQVDNAGHVLGAEALLRWEHPQQGQISPAQFIPLAEESGLILAIGDWVLHTACNQLKQWADNPLTRDLNLAVNVSVYQFNQPGFVNQLCKILIQTGANAARLKLELTESLLMQNVTETIEKMETLKQLGIRFSMDDFGTGYSSLSYLKNLPITQLKIDQSFVRDIIVEPSDAVIVQTIIGMANNLGINVIAEGVETEEQRACLEDQGCLAYQGYLFGKPVPLDQFEILIGKVTEQSGMSYDRKQPLSR